MNATQRKVPVPAFWNNLSTLRAENKKELPVSPFLSCRTQVWTLPIITLISCSKLQTGRVTWHADTATCVLPSIKNIFKSNLSRYVGNCLEKRGTIWISPFLQSFAWYPKAYLTVGRNRCIYFEFLVQLCQSSHKLIYDCPHLYRKHHDKTGRTKLWRNTRERVKRAPRFLLFHPIRPSPFLAAGSWFWALS